MSDLLHPSLSHVNQGIGVRRTVIAMYELIAIKRGSGSGFKERREQVAFCRALGEQVLHCSRIHEDWRAGSLGEVVDR